MKNEEYKKLNASAGGFAFTVMIILYLIISVLGQTIISLIGIENLVLKSVIGATFSPIAIIISIFLVKQKVGEKLNTICVLRKFNPIFILLALLFSFGMFFGLGFVNTLIADLLKNLGLNYPSISFPLENPLHLIIFSLTFALLPAFFEEIFFRGVLLNSINNGKIIISGVIIALFFALYHCSPVQLVYQFIYGVGLYFLVKVSGSVFIAIISHFINNFTVILFQYYKLNVDLFNGFIIASGIIALIIFSTICYLILKKQDVKNKKTELKSFIFPYGFIGGLACVLLMISGLF